VSVYLPTTRKCFIRRAPKVFSAGEKNDFNLKKLNIVRLLSKFKILPLKNLFIEQLKASILKPLKLFIFKQLKNFILKRLKAFVLKQLKSLILKQLNVFILKH
jgi:hypothetical protein